MSSHERPNADLVYLDAVRTVLEKGTEKGDRTGTGTISKHGLMAEYEIGDTFPALTTKRLAFNQVKTEALWLLSGESNIQPLVQNGNNIWNEWPYRHYVETTTGIEVTKEYTKTPEWRDGMKAYAGRIATDDAFAAEWGDLGPVYGRQWRHWKTPEGEEIDQVQNAIDLLKKDPESRRIIITAWNPGDTEQMAKAGLPPCHMTYQFLANKSTGKLDTVLDQRSADMFLGVPFNIASYALIGNMMAREVDMEPGTFVHMMHDAHIYLNHVAQIREQLLRTPLTPPTLWLNEDVSSLFDYKPDDIRLVGYESHPAIKGEVAV